MTDTPRLLSSSASRLPKEIIDKSGRTVDISGARWQLNGSGMRTVVLWDRFPVTTASFFLAAQSYVIDRIKRKAPSEATNTAKDLRWLAQELAVFENERGPLGAEIPYTFLSTLRSKVASDRKEYRLHRVRAFYLWAADQGFDGFSPDVAFRLSQLRLPGNVKGRAVLSDDPEEGPLTDEEVTALLSRLRSSDSPTLQERLALWLCFALGRNPLNYCLLLEDDFRVIEAEGIEAQAYELRVPRIKKRLDHARAEFKTQKIAPELAEIIMQLIEENRELRPTSGPQWLFRRSTSRPSAAADVEFSYQLHSPEFSELVQSCVVKLDVWSPRTGGPLKVTPRRLRYTFATRLVDEGISHRGLAEALDHTDLQHILVYFNARSNIVRRIDAAIAMRIAPLAQAFAGELVGSEAEAVRGNDPSSRIFRMNTVQGKLEGIGTCGSFSFCGLGPPIACYTCRKFQPWREAPHKALLDDLIADRDKKLEASMDPRMVKLLDPTIYAIADVVRRVEDERENPVAAEGERP